MIGCKLQATYGRLGVMMCHMLLGPLQTNLDDYTVKEKGACFMPRLIKLIKPAYMKPNDMDVFHVIFPFQLEGESAPTDLVFTQEMLVERHSGYIKEVREAPFGMTCWHLTQDTTDEDEDQQQQ